MALIGNIPWNKGVQHSAETREKIRLARAKQPSNKGWRMTEKQKDNVRRGVQKTFSDSHNVWNKGLPMRDETKQKLSAYFRDRPNIALIGRKYSAEHRVKLSKAKLGRKLSEEHKESISQSLKGRAVVPIESRLYGDKHPNYGKPAYKGSGIGKGSYCLKGHWVRSTWERGVADWLFLMGIEYRYEWRPFDLGDSIRFRPDFYIVKSDLWVEVKGYMTEKNKQQFARFINLGHKLFVITKKEWKLFQKTGQILRLAS